MDWLFGLGLVDSKTVIKQKWAGDLICKDCRQPRQHKLVEETEWSRAFWIKIIPARRERTLICTACRSVTKLNKADALQIMGAVPAR